jgi:hypothetical protein
MIWIPLVMVPDSSPRAYGGVRALLQRLLIEFDLCWVSSRSSPRPQLVSVLLSSGGCARAHPPGVAIFFQGLEFVWGVNPRPRLWCKGSPQASAHGKRVVKGALSFLRPSCVSFAERRGGICRATLDGRAVALLVNYYWVSPVGGPSPVR